MMWPMFGIYLLLLCGGSVLSACVYNDTQTQLGFNIDKFQGKWYEVYYTVKSFYGANDYWQDVSHVYTLLPNGSVSVDFVWRFPVTKACSFMTARLDPSTSGGKFSIVLIEWNAQYDYWVLSTDYTSYAIVYGCRKTDNQGGCANLDAIDVWVWSRQKTLTSAEEQIVNSTLSLVCVSMDMLEKTVTEAGCEKMPYLEKAEPCSSPDIKTSAILSFVVFLLHGMMRTSG